MYSQFAGSERRTGNVSRGSRDTPMELDKAAARGYRGTRSSVIGPSLGEGEAVRTRAAALDGTRRPARLIAPVVVASALIALLAGALPSPASATGFSATIRRTEGGIPHITAPNYAGLGYGYGYAFAQDNLCVMAEDYVTVDAERSRFFGPNGSYPQRGNGVTANNLDPDFFSQQIIDSHVIHELLAKAPPLGPEQEVRDLVTGYVAGYNRYLSDVGGTNGVPDSTCRGKPWVRPIAEADAYRRFYQ